jgi:hypothetical protein
MCEEPIDWSWLLRIRVLSLSNSLIWLVESNLKFLSSSGSVIEPRRTPALIGFDEKVVEPYNSSIR